MTKTAKKQTSVWLKIMFFFNVILALSIIGAYLSTHFSPNTVPYLYYLGLGYPILIGLTAIFILFWLIFKRKFVWFNLVIIAIGFNHFTNFFVFNINNHSRADNNFKILSYNVRIFGLYDKKNRFNSRNGIFDFLVKEQPDIACFQEFYHHEGGTEFVTKDSLIGLLNMDYIQEQYTHEMLGGKYFGLATFSKFPIINKGEIQFDNDPNNFCIYSDIRKGKDTVRIYNAHIGSIRLQDKDYAFFGDKETGEIYQRSIESQKILQRLKLAYEKRAIQIVKIMESIGNSKYPVVFCGDLNDTPVSFCYRQVSRQLNDAFVVSGNGLGRTYVGKIPSNRIDYIFYSNQLSSSEFITHDIVFSDHKPISAIINL